MRVHIKAMTDDRTVVLNISDTTGVANAAGVDPDAAELISELDGLFEDLIASNPDASVVELTPENAVAVLGGAEKKKKAKKAS